MSTIHSLHSLKKNFSKVDYVRWERRVAGHHVAHEVERVPWASRTPAHHDRRDKGRRVVPPTSTPHEKSAWISVPGRSREEVNKGLDDVSLNKNKNVRVLKLLIKSKEEAVSNLENLCASLLEMNMQMVREIVDTDRKSFFCARDILTEHHRLGKYISSFNDWSVHQMRQAKDGLNDAEAAAAKRCSVLREQLTKVEAELAQARAERHVLMTYKEKELPAQGLKATAIEKEINKLRETQQHELEDVSRVCQTVMTDLEKRYKAQEEEILSAVAEETLSRVPPVLHLMISHNCTMREEIALHRKVIKELEETCEELVRSIKELRRFQVSARRTFRHPGAIHPRREGAGPAAPSRLPA